MQPSEWIVFKFGGTSMGGAERIGNVASIVAKTLADEKRAGRTGARLAVVVSAMSGVTDALLNLTRLAVSRSPELEGKLEELKRKHHDTAAALLPQAQCSEVCRRLDGDFAALADVLRGISLLRECSDRARDFVSGLGEVWSATILSEHMKALGHSCGFVDAREVLYVEPASPSPTILWEKSQEAFASHRNANLDFLIVTGFVCKTRHDVPTVLGRNGSDYSASIFGYLLDAREIVIWTDVDGVMSADPRRVPDAVIIPELSYREAIELANFGAKVLHPMTMVPAVAKGIPILIKNTFRPDYEGSRIQTESRRDKEFAVKGCTTVDGVSLVTVRINGMQSLTSVASRLLSALTQAKVPVILATLGSPGNCISVAIPSAHAENAKASAEKEFVPERHSEEIAPVEVAPGSAILAIVGDGMIGNVGLASRFCGAIAKAGINIRAIAQGPDERNISVVIDSSEANRALRAAHAGFYLSPQTLSIGIVGTGQVARSLLAQLARIGETLRAQANVDLRVRGVMDSQRMLLSDRAIDPAAWEKEMEASAVPAALDAFVSHVHGGILPHSVLIDCTASSETANHFAQWLESGVHIITPNKNGNASSLSHYRHLQREMRRHERHYLYESMVCGALPVIETLADLVQTGDTLHSVEGIFSGALSEIFGNLDEGLSIEESCRRLLSEGMSLGSLVRELSGHDSRQAVVVLAREMGLAVEMENVAAESLLASDTGISTPEALWERVRVKAQALEQRALAAKERGEVLRYTGSVSSSGEACAGVRQVPANDRLAQARQGDGVVMFHTARYAKRPLVVQGPAGGPELTATAIFADLLRLTRYLGSMG